MPLPVTDTRPLFRPLTTDIVALLRSLSGGDWFRPTLARRWRVKDVVAHMLDTALRRLSSQRDGVADAPRRFERAEDLTAFLNALNAEWVAAADRLSPRVLTDLYALAGADLASFFESLPLAAPARIPVSWAGQQASPNWLDIGREFTEIWHHAAQVRDAVGAGSFADPAWLRAVLEISMHALPHAYRDLHAADGTTLTIVVTGDGGGTWTLRRAHDGWDVTPEAEGDPAAIATMTGETAWRLLYNGLPAAAAERQVHFDGRADLGGPLLTARSVIV